MPINHHCDYRRPLTGSNKIVKYHNDTDDYWTDYRKESGNRENNENDYKPHSHSRNRTFPYARDDDHYFTKRHRHNEVNSNRSIKTHRNIYERDEKCVKDKLENNNKELNTGFVYKMKRQHSEDSEINNSKRIKMDDKVLYVSCSTSTNISERSPDIIVIKANEEEVKVDRAINESTQLTDKVPLCCNIGVFNFSLITDHSMSFPDNFPFNHNICEMSLSKYERKLRHCAYIRDDICSRINKFVVRESYYNQLKYYADIVTMNDKLSTQFEQLPREFVWRLIPLTFAEKIQKNVSKPHHKDPRLATASKNKH